MKYTITLKVVPLYVPFSVSKYRWIRSVIRRKMYRFIAKRNNDDSGGATVDYVEFTYSKNTDSDTGTAVYAAAVAKAEKLDYAVVGIKKSFRS